MGPTVAAAGRTACGRFRPVRRALAGAAVLLVAGAASALYAPSALAAASGVHEHHGAGGTTEQNVCSDAISPGQARCFAHARTDAAARNARPARAGDSGPAGTLGNNGAYDPAYLQSAYNAPSATAGSGQTVAVVDAYDDPQAASDLANYRSYFGLPACTTTSGCFRLGSAAVTRLSA